MSNVWSRAIFAFGGKPVEQHQEADDRHPPVNGLAAETTVGVAATQNAAAEATAPQIDATQIADDNFVPEDFYNPPVLGYGYGNAEAIALEESAILTCATCGGIVFELDLVGTLRRPRCRHRLPGLASPAAVRLARASADARSPRAGRGDLINTRPSLNAYEGRPTHIA